MTIYSLTHLTGRARSAERRVVVMRFEIRRVSWFAFLGGFAAGIPLGAVAMTIWPLALLLPPLVLGFASVIVFATRQRRHMQVRHFDAIRHSLRAQGRIGNDTRHLRGVVLVAGEPLRPATIIRSEPMLAHNGREAGDMDLYRRAQS